jgi:serine/threonine protein kinase
LKIPDYDLIKRIGSGAYGEVWLAQGVTGALRAVKIVWREDFELTKTFHREFQGIQQFEPISRGHPGLVDVLHVGWNEERGYYYYVMELADDCEEGPHITDVGTYTPRTLSTDMRRHGRLDLHFCQEAGSFMADALHYIHQHGLTHRDIKPSNIIYCGGVCKIADIGLVAVSGERSFVGTEGFVPPEGPGTPQADIYSLGKVLYEMSPGKDRMEFPEVPDRLDASELQSSHLPSLCPQPRGAFRQRRSLRRCTPCRDRAEAPDPSRQRLAPCSCSTALPPQHHASRSSMVRSAASAALVLHPARSYQAATPARAALQRQALAEQHRPLVLLR